VRVTGVEDGEASQDVAAGMLVEEHLPFLAAASDILGSSLDYETELERVARLTVPALADWCVVDLLGEDGCLHRLAIVHRDSAKAETAAELIQRYPIIAPDQPHTIWRVLPTGSPWFDPDVNETRFVTQARDAEHLALLRRLGFAAEMVLPLVARDRCLGVITLVLADDSRRYGPRDLALAQELARRAALAIDNARLYAEAQAAEANQRFLASASAVLASSLDYEETLSQVAHLAVPHLADWCTVYLRQQDGSISRLAMAHGDPGHAGVAREVQECFTLDPDAATGVPHVVRTGEALLHAEATASMLAADTDRPDQQAAMLADLQIRSWMCVPLSARNRTFGAMSFVAAESGRRYRAADLLLAEDLARRAALAIDNARLYQEAQDAIRARDQFLSIAAHELRNPVTVLKGAVELLNRAAIKGSTEERRAWLVQQIAKAADRLVDLTDDLLDVSRIQLGQLPFRPDALDINEFLRELVTRYREQLDDRHRLTVAIPPAACTVAADAARLEQVVVNLLDNAVKYSPDGGVIAVTVRCEDTGVGIQVRDEGIGLPTEASEAIFEPFGRADNTGGLPGMGLGLHICRGIVERHGGRIWAESAGDGYGTTVSLWLPSEALIAEALARID
jgi:signal transduction histidine kinase